MFTNTFRSRFFYDRRGRLCPMTEQDLKMCINAAVRRAEVMRLETQELEEIVGGSTDDKHPMTEWALEELKRRKGDKNGFT